MTYHGTEYGRETRIEPKGEEMMVDSLPPMSGSPQELNVQRAFCNNNLFPAEMDPETMTQLIEAGLSFTESSDPNLLTVTLPDRWFKYPANDARAIYILDEEHNKRVMIFVPPDLNRACVAKIFANPNEVPSAH